MNVNDAYPDYENKILYKVFENLIAGFWKVQKFKSLFTSPLIPAD